jgi:hypothetical protein
MVRLLAAIMLIAAVGDAALARRVMWQPEPGIYTNEEQVYFAQEAGWAAPKWIGVKIERETDGPYRFLPIDRFGNPVDDPELAKMFPAIARGGKNGGDVLMRRDATQDYTLRRARPATCWAAVRKDKPKADGKDDWLFLRDIKLHDQGGRARAGGGDSGAQEVVIRMRNVIWPANKDGTPSTNRPSLVLYIHKPDQPDRAESYVWADPGAARIGINLRWMQASCTIDGAEKASEVNSSTFRG